MSAIFVAIIFFIAGIIMGTIMGLFVVGVGKINERHEYYHEGFLDGYAKAKEEIK